MNARAPSLPPALAGLRSQAVTLWGGMAPRERLALSVGLVVLGAFALWLLFIAPAWRTVRDAPAQLDRLEVQLQHMQRLAADAKSLRGAPAVSTAQAVDALKAATERLGDKASILFQGDRVTLTLTGVSGEALRDWLSEARGAARARPVEVQLARTPQGQNGNIVLTLGAAR
jgi:general secretion pathway protein M